MGGYDIVNVDWAYGNGSMDWEWEKDSQGGYNFNLTMPGYKSNAFTTFNLQNVEEVRFGNGTWLSPSYYSDENTTEDAPAEEGEDFYDDSYSQPSPISSPDPTPASNK